MVASLRLLATFRVLIYFQKFEIIVIPSLLTPWVLFFYRPSQVLFLSETHFLGWNDYHTILTYRTLTSSEIHDNI